MSGASLHPNHSYLLEWATRATRDRPGARVLDFGCGSGERVAAGRSAGIEMFGAETFYEGGSRREDVVRKGFLGTVIREIEDGQLPFDEGWFDLVVSNEVFEHVDDLEGALSEIDRVLTDEGRLVCLFPSVEVLREGHIGIPLAHRLRKGSRTRYAYALSFRALGLGCWKKDKPWQTWTRDALEWLDEYTVYRPGSVVLGSLSRHFRVVASMEDDYIRHRVALLVPDRWARLVTTPPLASLARASCRRLLGMAIVASGRRQS